MLNVAHTLLLAIFLLGQVSFAAAQPAKQDDSIVKFCKDNVGKKVGRGECTDLVEEALKAAGAKPSAAFKPSPGKDDYVWGSLVYVLEIKDDTRQEKKVPQLSVRPGDVIQFRNAKFQGKNYFVTCVHHTAVVLEVKEQDKVWIVLEQNVNGKKSVMERTYHLDDLKTGWIRVYRPLAK